MVSNTRGREAPMDYEWTNRPSIKPSWSQAKDDPSGSRKRPLADLQTTTPFGTPNPPIFGANRDVPFIFNQPTPKASHPHAWTPPANFTPTKAFPNPPEPNDVDMAEASPSKIEESKDEAREERQIAPGALRRIYKSRRRSQSKLKANGRHMEGEGDEDNDIDDHGRVIHGSTSNHYTLNMAPPQAQKSELPYVLLGYLQFGFNLSLTLIFLYLLIQFILTVQRDVEQRVSEYSMDIVQKIDFCARQYKTNLCANNAIPAMEQQCKNWEMCMSQDPAKIGRARVGAELIAEVVNGFVEPISWKALAFTLTSLAFLTLFINSLLSLFRSKVHPPHAPVPNLAPYPPIGEYHHPSLPPPPQWGHSRSRLVEEDYEVPSRRRRLEGGTAVKI